MHALDAFKQLTTRMINAPSREGAIFTLFEKFTQKNVGKTPPPLHHNRVKVDGPNLISMGLLRGLQL